METIESIATRIGRTTLVSRTMAHAGLQRLIELGVPAEQAERLTAIGYAFPAAIFIEAWRSRASVKEQ